MQHVHGTLITCGEARQDLKTEETCSTEGYCRGVLAEDMDTNAASVGASGHIDSETFEGTADRYCKCRDQTDTDRRQKTTHNSSLSGGLPGGECTANRKKRRKKSVRNSRRGMHEELKKKKIRLRFSNLPCWF